MKLSIIIPSIEFKNNISILTSLFTSLENQVAVNWNEIEILCIHNNNKFTSLDKDNFPIMSKQIKFYCVNKTLGGMKQFGLDVSMGEYVLFLQDNTILYCMTTLVDLLQLLTHSSAIDCIFCNVVNAYELTNNNELVINNSLDNIDGKIYKKDFLNQYNVHFLENLNYNEDLYFTQSFINLNPQYKIENIAIIMQIRPQHKTDEEETFINNLLSLKLVIQEYEIRVVNNIEKKLLDISYNVYKNLANYPNISFVQKIEKELAALLQESSKYIKCNNSKIWQTVETHGQETFVEFINRISQKDNLIQEENK